MAKSKLVSPSLIADMKAELEGLANTEPGAKDLESVVSELMPLICGCRDRGHSWSKISESLKKYHSELTISRLKRIAFELDPSLKSSPRSQAKSLIPDIQVEDDLDNADDDSELDSWPPVAFESKADSRESDDNDLDLDDDL